MNELAHIHGGRSDMAVGFEKGTLEDLPDTCVYRSPVKIPMSAFANVEALDFSFVPDFVPMKGFRPIPFDRIGLYRDEYRRSGPDKTVYRPQIYQKFKNDHGGRYNADKVRRRYPVPAYLN